MARTILPEPPEQLKHHSARLCRRISESMDESGRMPFSRFMEMALYEPGLGYYSAGLHKLGAEGDFVTAPELGPLFAACLARQFEELAGRIGASDILEVGAGTGRMAAGILGRLGPRRAPGRYRILERSADLRQVQRDRMTRETPELIDRVEWLDQPPGDDWQGLLLANEVIDALAVERFQVRDGRVEQLCAAQDGAGFCWETRPAPRALDAAVRRLEADAGESFEHGYRSELQLQLEPWLRSITGSLRRGLALFIDYGYPRREYYRPERRDGTLMCHYRHRAHDDPFAWPGLQDITAWVDFTALAEAADRCELDVAGYSNQVMFLLGSGLEAVLQEMMADSDDGGAALAAEARQLALPGMMGEKFQVMGLGRGLDLEPAGFSLLDLRYRL